MFLLKYTTVSKGIGKKSSRRITGVKPESAPGRNGRKDVENPFVNVNAECRMSRDLTHILPFLAGSVTTRPLSILFGEGRREVMTVKTSL